MSKNLAKQYQQKTDKQHILDNPDTYIGSIETVDSAMWICDPADPAKFVLKTIDYNPALYKLFDEGIVNARDHVVRMIQLSAEDKRLVTHISVTIDPADGTITIVNDGNGIDVEKHPENGLWIPEMVFGHLRTSTNYDKDEKKIVGGKNGFGFKLVLIWSTYGYIETVDHTRGLKYCQEFSANLDNICKPKITKCATKPYTKVVFRPDYARLKLAGLTDDMLGLLRKRVYDVAAVTDHSVKKIKVNYNDVAVPVKSFQQYVDMYIGAKGDCKRIYESANERWEYAVSMSVNHEFMQVSFVNGICTYKGGKHVDYLMGQITRKLCDYIEAKKKVRVNPSSIKEQLILFLRCDIVNPGFDSQTKEFLTTPSSQFGSSCSVSDGFIEKVAKMGVMDLACALTEAKEAKQAQKTDGAKVKSLRGIEKLVDANLSGTKDSHKCVLILCEGLSAKSGVVSGLTSDDRNYIGVYPLKGKLMNVRGEATQKVHANEEISDIKKILGLESGRKYETIEDVYKHLRYGKIMFMTDQDLDGSHIKGLCINLFASEWESLFRIPGFMSFMNTPILRATKGAQTLRFYNEGEYNDWKATVGDGAASWKIKYFKGLGTSVKADFQEYFANRKIVDFVFDGSSDDVIDKVFNKKRVDDRKQWLENYDKTRFLNTNKPQITYSEFVDEEMIHFSIYDCARSIANMVDGLKTSQRKILYTALKHRLTNELKVAQFAADVSKESAYHHGEASLNAAIVNMAQNYVGSNNINLLDPNGQFGTRSYGGKDSASERYIFTQLNRLTRFIFPEADDAVLTYLSDDGKPVEPEYYVPIIPFALVNGISGIGTGFSCDVPAYSVEQIVRYLRTKLVDGKSPDMEFVPYYEGFRGTVQQIDEKKYLMKGVYEIAGDVVTVLELPVGTWTTNYVKMLNDMMADEAAPKPKAASKGGAKGGATAKKAASGGGKKEATIKDVEDLSTDTCVRIQIQFQRGTLQSLIDAPTVNGVDGVEKFLKLATTISTNNMHLFDSDIKLHKYDTAAEIIDAHYTVRMNLYDKRKKHQIAAMEKQLVKLSNRALYIKKTLDGTVDLRRKTADQVVQMLSSMKFTMLADTVSEPASYKYLVKMPMDSVTAENVARIMEERENLSRELETLRAMSLEAIWLKEIDLFDTEYKKYQAYRDTLSEEVKVKKAAAKSGAKPKMPAKKK
jgi:DNA topoisomerase-2